MSLYLSQLHKSPPGRRSKAALTMAIYYLMHVNGSLILPISLLSFLGNHLEIGQDELWRGIPKLGASQGSEGVCRVGAPLWSSS